MEFLDKNPFIRNLLENRQCSSPSGALVPLVGDIRLEYAEALYEFVRSHKPRRILELGMAFGVSTLVMLAALEENGGEGEVVSIDPFQDHFQRCGIANVRLSGLSRRHTLMAEPDWVALPQLVAGRFSADFAYIDGSHAFENVMLDTFYADKLLRIGGAIAYNDCGLAAVDAVIRYLQVSRHYEEIETGLTFVRGRSFGIRTAFAQGWWRPGLVRDLLDGLRRDKLSALWRPHQDRYFRKCDDWVVMKDIRLPF